MTVVVNLQFSANEGKVEGLMDLMQSDEGLALTRNYKGCQKIQVAADPVNNKCAYWELWDSVEDWDAYFAMRQEKFGETMAELFDFDTFSVTIMPHVAW